MARIFCTAADSDTKMVHGRARASPRQTLRVALNEGSEERKDGNPLVDGRLTVRRMRRVDRTVESMCDQVVEAIVCFGVPAPKGRGWF